MTALWTTKAIEAATRGTGIGTLPADVAGISIDSRAVAPGEAYFAIKGDVHDGHDFVGAALKAGGGLAVVARDRLDGLRDALGDDTRLIAVDDVLAALRDLGAAARALALGANGATHASAASFNNHWGVPLSLSRLAVTARYGVFEIGMNHAGEITPLTRLVRPHVAIVTTVEPVHLEFFASVEAIADAKAEIFLGLEKDGAAVLNRDNVQFQRLEHRAAAEGAHVVSFGENARAEARLLKCALQPDGSTVEANILGVPVAYKIGALGKHLVMNSLAVLAAASLAGADLARAALALARQAPAAGRGTRVTLDLASGSALLIDESYNANPTSMQAALALLGQAPLGPHGRRIAVLGDMLELGAAGPELHQALIEPIRENEVDLVFCAGPLMASLWQALPSATRGGYANTAADLEPLVLSAVRGGDAVMVKASAGSRMGPIVKALVRRHSTQSATEPARARG
jgi:UDP-N-acetylmuramoyl-tripeptide--D-alanyl-D-alanine ligase